MKHIFKCFFNELTSLALVNTTKKIKQLFTDLQAVLNWVLSARAQQAALGGGGTLGGGSSQGGGGH